VIARFGSLVEVVIPLVLVLGTGAIGLIPDRAALVAATAVALVELAAAGEYAAIRRGAGARGIVVSAAIAGRWGSWSCFSRPFCTDHREDHTVWVTTAHPAVAQSPRRRQPQRRLTWPCRMT
jgi:hypothetical protein